MEANVSATFAIAVTPTAAGSLITPFAFEELLAFRPALLKPVCVLQFLLPSLRILFAARLPIL